MKRYLSVISAMLLAIVLFVGCAPQESTEKVEKQDYDISIADTGLESGRVNNMLVGLVAEHVFGYQWHEVSGSTPITHTAMIKNELDLKTEMWSQNLASYDEDIAEKRIIELGVNFGDNQQGIYVPRYVIEGDPERGIEPMAPDLKTVQDLEKYADIFVDPEDSSKGVFYGGVSGWECDTLVFKKFEAYGLDEMYNYVRPGTESAMVATMLASYERGEALVGYYWEPNWILGQYDFVLLDDEPYNLEGYLEGVTEFPSVKVTTISSPQFYEDHPEYCEFLSNFNTTTELLSESLSYMQDTNSNYEETARMIIEENPELVETWLTPEQLLLLTEGLNKETTEEINPLLDFPFELSLNTDSIDEAVMDFSVKYQDVFDVMKSGLTQFVTAIRSILDLIPWWIFMLLVAFLGYKSSGTIKKSFLYCAMLSYIGLMGLWDLMNETLSIVLASVLIALLIGLPIGILISGSKKANALVRPILDTMQTMPVFVYLIPAVIFFGMGSASAIIATVIYAVVPVIRLTSLGICQVDSEIVEAAKAFGSTKRQTLIKVQIPQALPTIMAGVNQTMMMAMAMVVTCSMIGARGLGDEVLTAVNRIEISKGLINGTAVVVLAVLLDRLTQGWFGEKKKKVVHKKKFTVVINKLIGNKKKEDGGDV